MCWFFKKRSKEDSKQKSKQIREKESAKGLAKTTLKGKTSYSGKYEIFPEARLYKYRLKASNGEVLIVSSGYSSRKGAVSGIKTLKKSVKNGNFKFVTDKSNYTQFRLYNINGARLIASGEYYKSLSGAEAAMESVKVFIKNNKIIQLKKIPQSEIREEVFLLKKIEKISSGKYQIFLDEKNWKASLIASNGQVLFTTSGYYSKSNLIKAIISINREIDHESFSVSWDKQNRYQFKIYSSNNTQLVVGETYNNKADVVSAINSVRRFASNAKIVGLAVL